MSLVYPGGAPLEDDLDSVLQQAQAGVRRRRSAFEPPSTAGPTPRFVPKALFREAERHEVLTLGERLAVLNDGLDLAVNARIDGTREMASGFSTIDDARPPLQRILDPVEFDVDVMQQQEVNAIARIRREGDRPDSPTTQYFVPEPDRGGFVRPDEQEDRGILSRVARIARGATSAAGGVLNFADDLVVTPQELVAASLGKGLGAALQASGPQQILRASSGEAASHLARSAKAIGKTFDGKEFWRSVWVNGGAGLASGWGLYGDFDGYQREAEERFDRYWEDLPRPAQLFVEELNAGNIAIALAGGPLSRVLTASGTRGATFLAKLVEPLAANPIKAVGLEVGASAAARGGYEATEGAPGIVRVGAALAAGGAVAAGPDLTLAGLRRLDNFLGDAPAGHADPSRRGMLAATIFPGMGPSERAIEMQKVREAYRANNPLPDSVGPKAQGLTPLELMRLDFEAAQEDLLMFTRAREVMDAADWGTREGTEAAEAQLRALGVAENLWDETLLWEAHRDAQYDVRALMKDLQAAGEVEVKDLPPLAGFARASDAPLPIRSALGDGGMMKAGHPDEMIDPITREVMDSWRNDQGDVLSAQIIPGLNTSLRPRRPSGSKLTPIPHIIPAQRPMGVRGVIDRISLRLGASRAGNLFTASTRAADLAAQEKMPVPAGAMHQIRRAEATLDGMGRNPLINWFNQASGDPVVRAGIQASKYARSEVGARIGASRAQFMGRVREMFGSTDRLPDRIQYVGPALRKLHGADVAAEDYPMTGTIIDFITHPSWYSDDIAKYLPEFRDYDVRNSAVSGLITSEYGVTIGEFDTGIAATQNQNGIFFPTIDGGAGKIAGGGTDQIRRSTSGRLRTRDYQTIDDRLADPMHEGFEPITDLEVLFASLDESKINAAQRETLRWAVGGSLEEVPGWQRVTALETDNRQVWLPREQAEAVQTFMTSREHEFFQTLERIKNTRLGGDGSPLLIQGSIGWALSPLDSARDIVMGLAKGAREGDVLRPFRSAALYQDMAADPARWLRFFTYIGHTPSGGTPAEWRTGFLENLPIIGGKIEGMSDAMTNALLRGMEADFTEFTSMIVQRGFGLDEAAGAAADMVKMGWLQQNFDQLGVKSGRRAIERGLAISTTFIRNPINLMENAASGYLKLAASPLRLAGSGGQWTHLTPREQLATQMFAKMTGTFTGMAAISAAVTAEERGWDPGEAIQRAILDVNGPDWMVLWFGKDVKIPLGGPYRSLIRAVAPQPVEVAGGVEIPLPFAGIAKWAQARVTTSAGIAIDLIRNEDFGGNRIVTEEGVLMIAQALAYIGKNAIPIVASSPLEALERGESFRQGIGRAAFEFMGQNPLTASEFERLERERRISARAIYNMPPEAKRALALTDEQIEAGRGARTLAQLREAIGTRAANYAAELANPAVAGARDKYAESLRRRADNGDQGAEALLISLETQERLTALAQSKTKDGLLDRVEYRLAASQIKSEGIGRSQAFAKVFEGFRESTSPVDRASAQWYDLFDKAMVYETVDGKDVPIRVDFDAFEQMENEFFQAIGPEMAALVEANVATAPAGANSAEVELRQHKRDLRDSGYWDIDRDLWQQWKGALVQASGVPEDLQDAISGARSFSEFRAGAVRYLAGQLSQENGYRPETALQVAKSVFDGTAEAQGYARDLQIKKAEWAQAHVEDGLAEAAIQWGYLSDSALNQNAGGVFEGNEQRKGGSNPTSTPAPQPTPARIPPMPRGAALETGQPDELVTLFMSGLSYGQIATKTGRSRGAVEQALRLRLGGSPQKAREAARGAAV
jgi:hypothetical protein